MEKFFEQRGDYNIACYKISVDEKMKNRAFDFAKQIVLSDNQYSRLLPSQIKGSEDIELKQKIEIQRTYMGKLGEIAFLKFLYSNNKRISYDGMFNVYEGQENVDSYDFITKSGYTVDVKTGFRKIHKRLLINIEQFDKHPKNYYVAVKLNAKDVDPNNKLVDWDDITTATIYGFEPYDFLFKYAKIRDFGEGPARWWYYDQLLGIDTLLKNF